MSPRELPATEKIDYVALSHCWGGAADLLKLTANNEHLLRSQIVVDTLPQTFKEAISVCLGLEFHYIWIDSLCIIQKVEDGAEAPGDWLEQAAEMDLVYGNAIINLCMAGSAKPSEPSFLSRDVNLMLPSSLTLTGYDGKEATVRLICDGLFEGDIKASPIRKRGWVFQEWYLAKRSLILGRMQLWWHCREELACETFPKGISSIPLLGQFVEEAETMKGIGRLQDSALSEEHWWGLIKQYAKTRLTEETKDRIIAFSGISRNFVESHNIANQYVAGMWRCHLPQALLWYRFCGGETFRSLDYKAPSWSWMSLDGPFTLKNHSERSGFSQETPRVTQNLCCSVERVYLPLVDQSNATGRLNGGFIEIHGHLLELDSHRIDQEDLMGETRWDEEDDKGDPIISYLDNMTLDMPTEGALTGFPRIRVPLEHAKGSTFALPILRRTYKYSRFVESSVSCLILFQPLHQPNIFYRVASYRGYGNLDHEQLKWEYLKKSIRIY